MPVSPSCNSVIGTFEALFLQRREVPSELPLWEGEEKTMAGSLRPMTHPSSDSSFESPFVVHIAWGGVCPGMAQMTDLDYLSFNKPQGNVCSLTAHGSLTLWVLIIFLSLPWAILVHLGGAEVLLNDLLQMWKGAPKNVGFRGRATVNVFLFYYWFVCVLLCHTFWFRDGKELRSNWGEKWRKKEEGNVKPIHCFL